MQTYATANRNTKQQQTTGKRLCSPQSGIWRTTGRGYMAAVGSQPGPRHNSGGKTGRLRNAEYNAHKASLGYATATALAYGLRYFIYAVILFVIRIVLHL